MHSFRYYNMSELDTNKSPPFITAWGSRKRISYSYGIKTKCILKRSFLTACSWNPRRIRNVEKNIARLQRSSAVGNFTTITIEAMVNKLSELAGIKSRQHLQQNSKACSKTIVRQLVRFVNGILQRAHFPLFEKTQ